MAEVVADDCSAKVDTEETGQKTEACGGQLTH